MFLCVYVLLFMIMVLNNMKNNLYVLNKYLCDCKVFVYIINDYSGVMDWSKTIKDGI